MAQVKTFYFTAQDGGTDLYKEVRMDQGLTGNFNYLVQRVSGAATAVFDAYQSPVRNATLSDALAFTQKSLGNTDQLTKALAADAALRERIVTIKCNPSAAGQWQVTLISK